jgi:hypothetical protein
MEMFGYKIVKVASTEPVDVTVVATTPTKARRVFLGSVEFKELASKDTSTISIPPGTYTLFWSVFGVDGQTYNIEITAPDSAKWKSKDRKIVGNHTVGAESDVEVK